MVTVTDNITGKSVDCDKFPNNETCTEKGFNRIKNANTPDNKGIFGLGVLGLGGKKRTNKKKAKKSRKNRRKTTKK
jgi:hypothetical protein